VARTALVRPAAIRSTPWQVRAGWLLRAHRLRHADPALRRLPGFARVYAEGHRGTGGISPSSLSRWENGLVPVTPGCVRRYEDVLGLAAHSLLAPIQTIARHEGGSAAAAFLCGGGGPTPLSGSDIRIDPLLDRVLDNGMLTGDDWDELTRWAAYGSGHLSPRRIRHAVVHRLLEETVVADGTSWMRRFESLGRLLADPLWAPEAIAVCAAVAREPEHAGLVEAVCALDGSSHPDAGRAVLRQLTDPTTADSQYGALLAAARKTRKHHFTAEQTRTLVEVVEGVLCGSPEHAHVEAAAAPLHRLPLSTAHTTGLITAAADHSAAVQAIVVHGSLTDPASASITVARVLAKLSHDNEPTASTVLRDILDDLLHHPVADVRLYAALLLRASPYGHEVAAALAGELRQPGALHAKDRAVPLLHALRALGDSDQRAVVADLTLARGVPQEVVQAAVHALGHIGGHSAESYWRAVFNQHTRSAPQHQVVKRLVYGFAMAGELDLLTRLVDELTQVAPAQRLSSWWTHLAPHIRESARH